MEAAAMMFPVDNKGNGGQSIWPTKSERSISSHSYHCAGEGVRLYCPALGQDSLRGAIHFR
jgi:hypothetical protein